jgi:hypothetical protein
LPRAIFFHQVILHQILEKVPFCGFVPEAIISFGTALRSRGAAKKIFPTEKILPDCNTAIAEPEGP